MQRIVILGAGQAGAAAAARLRALGHAGPITLIGEEAAPPYQRPPLSKAFLMGEIGEERLYLRPVAFWAEQGIELRSGCRATGIDRVARQVGTTGGRIPYDALILATGAVPRRLPGAVGGDLPGAFTLRGIADVEAMRPAMQPGARLLVVGGGYIGLEAAAVARKLGLEVVLVEAAPRILGRVACPETAEWFRDLHRGHGVTIHEGTGLARLKGPDRVRGAVLADGRQIDADLAIVGVGVTPGTALAETAGLAIANGIATDAFGRTSDESIWACGDCASFPVAGGGRLRLESVQNAIDMAETVAANLMGAAQPYAPVPWFWSDQYDAKLQIAGLNSGYDGVAVRQGTGGARSHWYFAGDRLLAVDAMNDSRAYMVGKRLVETGRSPAADVLADPATDLKALLKA
ncbi:MAG TPA: FAD-dependent oxidoreductase [Paracoccaceae bacterium]|nr:FAD-dependent oxidoreductase [Paracoccaceae bacterium]HMO70174.1 FAD-dependent oxidoreductase [Paracoccaceae bacterium]